MATPEAGAERRQTTDRSPAARYAAALSAGARDGVIALFGGTFDPVHLAHLLLAEWVRDALGLERIVLVPSGRPPHKRAATVSAAHHRLAMLELATAGQPGLVVADFEIAADASPYTIDSVRGLRAAGAREVLLVIGADSLLELDTWHEPDALLAESRLVVVPRSGHDIAGDGVPAAIRERVTLVDAPRIDIAARDIRARARDGRSIRFLVPEAVREYIARHGLYQREQGA